MLLCARDACAELFDSTNDFGGVGLLQTPTARFADDGEFGVGVSHVKPYNQIHILAEPLPWLETVFRYTDVTNVAYGPQSFSGNQSYKDRSFGIKLRLLQEGEILPAVSLGILDFGGTGVFSSEYLVASRRYYDFDFSLGVAWGRLGAGGDIGNPLGLISSHFEHDRTAPGSDGSTPGAAGLSRLFTGKVGLFGGAQWHTPIPGVSVVVEYDGNDYKHEALNDNQPQATHVNFGLTYRPTSAVQLGIGYERGDTLSFNVEFRTNFEKFLGPPKSADPPPPPIRLRPEPKADEIPPPADIPLPVEQDVVARLKAALADQKFYLVAVDFDPPGREIQVWIHQGKYRNPAQVVGRTARILTEVAPDQVERFTVINLDAGSETYRVTVLRKDFEKVAIGQISPEEILVDSEIRDPKPGDPHAEFPQLESYPKYSYDMGPGVRQQIGGPDGFYFGQLLWRLYGAVSLNDHLSFGTEFSFNIINNLTDLKQTSNSQLPHVRSDIVQYLQNGKNPLDKLETNYIWSPFQNWYARGSAGIFEDMFGGVAGELLYRPFGKRWAVGFDVNHVWQRSFDERFDFRGYNVTTGFVTVYYDFPIFNLLGSVSAGRYLAGDNGATISLARRFDSGVIVGGFATFTDVSAAQFGEGSFDKGIYISVPFDLFFSQSSRNAGTLLFRPLTRDGGQRARDGTDLYSATDGGSLGRTTENWPEVIH